MAVRMIGLDIAKHVFQVHGADANGKAVLKKRLRREQVTDFFGSVSRCVVGDGGNQRSALLGSSDRNVWS